ncbi:MAG: sigma-70 family RNA polymerase sigma factor [Chloroflexi bacterium]|nr:sigma-70 family RNA polymerase sigma factor [Chloroflexota bacterium]
MVGKLDEAAFTRLYDEYVDRVYGHVHYRIGNRADVEDITQEAFIRAWKALDKYKDTGAPFVAWLITIADNLVVDYYRKQKKQEVPIDEVLEMPAAENLEALAEAKLDGAALRNAVMKLKGDKARVVMMHFIDGFSYEEIARALKKSEGAIRVIQYRALGDLRKILDRQ